MHGGANGEAPNFYWPNMVCHPSRRLPRPDSELLLKKRDGDCLSPRTYRDQVSSPENKELLLQKKKKKKKKKKKIIYLEDIGAPLLLIKKTKSLCGAKKKKNKYKITQQLHKKGPKNGHH
jgi:hypothetical protein